MVSNFDWKKSHRSSHEQRLYKVARFLPGNPGLLFLLFLGLDNGVGTKTDAQKPNYHGQQSIRTRRHAGTPVTVLIFRPIFPSLTPPPLKLLPASSPQLSDIHNKMHKLNMEVNRHRPCTSHFSSAETHQEIRGDKHLTDKSIHCFIALPWKIFFSSSLSVF